MKIAEFFISKHIFQYLIELIENLFSSSSLSLSIFPSEHSFQIGAQCEIQGNRNCRAISIDDDDVLINLSFAVH